MEVIAYTLYYAMTALAVWFCCSLRKFTLEDYKYNKSLQLKRRWIIIYTYFAICLQGIVAGAKKLFFIYPISDAVSFAALIIAIIYTILLIRVERPKHPFNKK